MCFTGMIISGCLGLVSGEKSHHGGLDQHEVGKWSDSGYILLLELLELLADWTS